MKSVLILCLLPITLCAQQADITFNKELNRVAFGSCSKQDLPNKQLWTEINTVNPDLWIWLGDNIYADTEDMARMREMYDHQKSHPDYQRLQKSADVIGIWDDHDYGMNDGNKMYRDKAESLKMYHQFFPTKNNTILKKSFATGFQFNLGKHKFFFLDDRYFRDPDTIEKGYHFGVKQRKWLFEELTKSKASLNWLVSGDQFFGGYHRFESFEGNHNFQFQKFKQELKSLNKKYALISGDRHLVEVMEIPELELGTLTYEYTISGVHSAMFPGNLGDPKSNPYRVDGFDGESNYAVLTISNKMNDFNQVHFQAYSLKGEKINRIDSF